MGKQKCRSCVHYAIQYSHIAKGYVESCDVVNNAMQCEGYFENKKKKASQKPVAFIKVGRNKT